MRKLLTNKQRREIDVLEFLTHIGTPQQVKKILQATLTLITAW